MAEVVLQDYRQIVLQATTPTTTSGSAIFDGFGAKEMVLIINVTSAPTGTTPSITFSINEVDPGDLTTLLGNSSSGSAITTGPTTQIVDLPMMYSGTVQVSWTVSGTTPSFPVYASLVSKVAGTTSLWNESGVSAMGTAGSPGAAVVSVQGVSGGTAIPISGSITISSGTVTANQGTPNTLANGWPVEITDGTNVLGTSAHPLYVTFSASGDRMQSGSITSNQAIQIDTQGTGNVGVTITGSWTGTIAFQASIDGTNFFAVNGLNVQTGAPTQTVTANGQWTIPCAGYQLVQAIGATVATGSASVALDAGVGAPPDIQVAAGGMAAAGSAPVGYPALIAPLTDNNIVGQFAFGEAYRLRVGNESLGFLENFDGTTVNTVRWTQSTATMTQSQAQTSFDMNHNATTTASTYSILTSTKYFMYTGEYATETRIKAKLTPQTNSVIELGFLACSGISAPTNGVFFRITSAGVQELVINYGGTETTSTIATALSSSNYYCFVLYMYGRTARLDILNWDNSLFATTTLQTPATQAALIQIGHIPVAIRVYNTASAPASAPDALLSGVSVSQLDLAGEKAWETQLGDISRFANTDPLLGTQLQNYTNSTAPSTIAAGSLSNTTAAYTTLGGQFAFNPPASAETDFILFAYQVPTGFDLLLWSVSVQTMILAVQSTTTPQVFEWGLAVGSSAVSLATGSPNPPIRQAIGMQQAPKSASVGDSMNPAQLIWTPRVPIVCYGGKYVHIFVRCISSNLTPNQVMRGIVTVDGAFQ